MKLIIIFFLLFSNLAFAIQLPKELQELGKIEVPEGLVVENGGIFMGQAEEETKGVWYFFKSIFVWIWQQVSSFWSTHIWPRISGPLEREIDTRKQQVEEKIEETTESIKESLLERFKRIIRYEEPL